jgi:hypothetical protein
MSDILYLVIGEGLDWDDIVILTDRERAIEMSIKYPHKTVELFYFNKEEGRYIPAYSHFVQGKFYDYV